MKTLFKHVILPVICGTFVASLLLMSIQPFMPVHAQESESKCWAVIVGVSDYQYYSDLLYNDDDARELSQLLSPIWGADHVKLLTNSEATKAGINDAITNWLAAREDANDTVLFYFSGANLAGDIGPYDVQFEGSGISPGELDSWLDTLDSEKVAIILETPSASGFETNLRDSGRVVLMASRSDEGIWYSDTLKHHYFTYYLLQALTNFDDTDANHDYELSAEEIFQYAEPETTSSHSDQHPVLADRYSGELSLLMKFTFSTEADLPSGTTILTLDGMGYSSAPPPLIWAPGSAHSLEVPSSVDAGVGTRYFFASWDDGDTSASRTISQGGAYTASYKTQYLLTIESAYGEPEGAGWYDADSTALIQVASIEGATTKYIFTGWSGDFSEDTATASVIMDEPKTVATNWRIEYLLTIESAYGEPEGAGWYSSGSTATISATSPQGTIIRQVFTRWSGDFSGDTATASITVNSPMAITANWQTDYLQLIMIIFGVVIIAVALILWKIWVIRKKTPIPAPVKETVPPSTTPSRCVNCGADIETVDIFCIKCGKRV
ncbi:caspase family protein [Chloroflexota bacterium]